MTKTSLNDLLGRFFMIGFKGKELTPDVRDLFLKIRPGGIILFKRNVTSDPEQVAGLTRACQDLALAEFGRPLLVAIDQEGGPVRRLGPPFSVLPSQREMAERLSLDEVRAWGETSGRELAAVGINLNLTPVLDLQTEPQATYMAERSFGSNPEHAAALGLALIDGHARHNVLTCAKHFPGIGDTRLDPHHDLPKVSHSAGRLWALEIMPFSRAAEHGVAAIMTAHVVFSGLDPKWPGTFSRKILTGILRTELGFPGLILTDDLEMGAVIKHYQAGPAAVRAVQAGADMLLICHRADRILEAWETLTTAVYSGEITRARLEETSARLDTALADLTLPQPGGLHKVFDHD